MIRFFKNTFLFLLITMLSCGRTTGQNDKPASELPAKGNSELDSSVIVEPIIPAANRTEEYLPLLKDKRIGIIANQSSLITIQPASENPQYKHLVDSLVNRGINVTKVFAPEHGFRGTADAGEAIKDGKDPATGIPVTSLYGDNKKPTSEQLKDLDLLVFDLQDVGARFYTYISTLHYVMEAAAENNIPIIVFDRPNPNGHYVDGPILEPEHKSFIGMHPVPVVHGMTMGEYAQMINGENWLKNGSKADLKVIKIANYDHSKPYELPVKPSPNLPNAQAVNLYPSICFFEGTNVNEGRGTNKQFQVFGSPFLDKEIYSYSYTPESMEGAKHPKHLGLKCYGKDLSEHPRLGKINLTWLIEAYQNTSDKEKFFIPFFTKLAGNTNLQQQIEKGISEEEIRESWKKGLEDFKLKREKYLLYQ